MRVLVEDEIDLADAVAAGLRREGYAVDVAHAGDETVRATSATAPKDKASKEYKKRKGSG